MTATAISYDRHKERTRERQAFVSRSGRDIAPIPPCRNPRRRIACRFKLALALGTYFPETFYAPFSDDHLALIHDLEEIILEGGRRADAVYRAFGKTSIAERAIIWGALNGHRLFFPIIGAEQAKADEHVSAIKTELEQNPLLLEDFPEVCYPLTRLEGISQRTHGQLYYGQPTHIAWTADKIVLPTIPRSAASGVIIASAGLTSSKLRGLKYTRPDRKTVRPDFYLIDDPQTDESAASPTQVQKRLKIITRAILRSSGHMGTPLAVFVAGTLITPDDVMDELTDHERTPSWQGRRIPLVKQMPTALEKLWLGPYAELRRAYNPELPGDQLRAHAIATAYYQEHRQAMDAGCLVSWEGCCEDGELSAIQHAINIFIDDGEAAFAAECQQAPELEGAEDDALTPEIVLSRLNGRKRATLPPDRHVLAAHIDLHDKLLYWLITALDDGFTGEIVDYGTYPDQRRHYFTQRDARVSLMHKHPGVGKEAALQAALEALSAELLARSFRRDDGEDTPLTILGIDIGYKPHIVKAVLTQLGDPRIMPTRGQGLGAANRPFAEYRRKAGERLGHHWWRPSVRGTKLPRHLRLDANYWKRFAQQRLATAPGDPGAITLWGKDANRHRMLADHLAKSETAIRTEGQGRVVYEYRLRPAKPDNHLFDNLTACLALSSYRGLRLPAEPTPTETEARRRHTGGRRRARVRYVH